MYTYHSLTADEPVTNVTVLGNYEVGYEEDFEKDDKKYHGCFGPNLKEFEEQLGNDGMSIKVGMGY